MTADRLAPSLSGVAADTCHWIARLIHDWRERHELDRELAALPPGERHRMLAELGLSEDDLDALVTHGDQVSTLMPRALALRGLSLEALAHDHQGLLHDLQRTCAHCADPRRCRHLLAEDAPVADHDEVCPNASTMAALKG
ncbi:DUF6455 family protein [Azospirillum thermophilum]|uniref:DUF6455 domain-containing protein n=1 Tax=Azospirillum thermophilum TaxID=2202148 RepID=A0A2S2CZI2_9PROT|nr:DUF6455 family protein [Azospirillum thermophilum]AWK89921.1 hypothetical protein DEW08_28320 [Azospirillum thermophilum]